ncbi:hypothetical protein [Deinococcus alpinitundrae]|uniref:hypothetical protein n=1 Tax=Deinococcus alpinitundrae TaxID=468913 RepID=UPI00137ADC1B|nr:hypothetical protein [Deinococcus alpinitundrae]
MNHLSLLFLAALLPHAAATVVRTPISTARPAAFRSCTVGELRLTTDAAGKVRFLEYGQNIPDNSLRVRQSYDRAGRLTGISVTWSGFAGQMLDARAAYDARGQLIRETGYRRSGFTTPLKSYIRAAPPGARC